MSTNTQTPLAATVPAFEMRHRLRRALEHADMEVGEMSEYLGVARTTMSNWFAGRTAPKVSALRLWAMRTGVPYEWLVTGEAPGDPDGGVGQEVPSTIWRSRVIDASRIFERTVAA